MSSPVISRHLSSSPVILLGRRNIRSALGYTGLHYWASNQQQCGGLFNQPLETHPINEPQWHYVSHFYEQCAGFCIPSSCQVRGLFSCSLGVIRELRGAKTGNGAQRAEKSFYYSPLWSDQYCSHSQEILDNTSCSQVLNYLQIRLLSTFLSPSLASNYVDGCDNLYSHYVKLDGVR